MMRQESIGHVVGTENSPNVEAALRASLNVMAIHPLLVLRRCQVKQMLAQWRAHMRSRTELMNLSDRCLQDIGMSRCTADFEASKPFWMA
jgi:uncharacterized protein YjiS (DUF1127 family)